MTYYSLNSVAKVTEDKGYFPVIYSLSGSTTTSNTSTASDSLKAVADTIAKKLGATDATVSALNPGSTDNTYKYTGLTQEFKPNQSLATLLNLDNAKITWTWAIETGSDDTAKANNAKDTILGLLAAPDKDKPIVKLNADNTTYTSSLTEFTDYCVKTQFTINITVTQED
jgi:hypothetical protein